MTRPVPPVHARLGRAHDVAVPRVTPPQLPARERCARTSRFTKRSSLAPTTQDSSPTPAPAAHVALRALLADPEVLASLAKIIARRIPERAQEDCLQDCCVAALAAKASPDDPAACEAWLRALVRNRVASFFRQRFEEFDEAELDDLPAPEAPADAREQLAWVEREVADGRVDEETMDWMVRQADGEMIQSIAREAGVKAARIRQRLRYHRCGLRARWSQRTEES